MTRDAHWARACVPGGPENEARQGSKRGREGGEPAQQEHRLGSQRL